MDNRSVSIEEMTDSNAARAFAALERGSAELKKWHDKNSDADGNSALSEVARRYERMLMDFSALVDLNKRLIDEDQMSMTLDHQTDTLTFSMWGQPISVKVQRKDPNIPLQIIPLTSVSAYEANHAHKIPGDRDARLELESRIENFYQNAHRMQKLLQAIFSIKRNDCRAITMVRNHLIEHKKEDIGYSFGVGPSGPRVQPTRPANREIYNDEGLFSNAEEFGEYISSLLGSARL